MHYEVLRTSAEHVVGAVDATLQMKNNADAKTVADFLDTTEDNAENALKMAVELGFLEKSPKGYSSAFPLAEYLITSRQEQKATVFRFVLEKYEPYRIFKNRLQLSNRGADAARETKALLKLKTHQEDIKDTLVNFGTYASSLVVGAGGQHQIRLGEAWDFIKTLDNAANDRQTAASFVRERLGNVAVEWVNHDDVLEELVTAYQKACSDDRDKRSVVVHAGNAVESFFSQLATHHRINVSNAPGINAKAQKLANQQHLSKKHLGISKYLGHVRNAADHGIDPEIGNAWAISENTATEYIYVAISMIKSVIAKENAHFQL
ncbi:MAG: hypothetical protein JXA82_06070 [Sedimentisphaerales bacterium]|nr:hypothetical protein [Sedimentisphaerales bacterium]